MPTNKAQEPVNQILDMALRLDVCSHCLAIAKDCLETLNKHPEALKPEEYIKWLRRLGKSTDPMERTIAKYLLAQVQGKSDKAAVFIIMNKALEAALYHFQKVQDSIEKGVMRKELSDPELEWIERFIKGWNLSVKMVFGIVAEAKTVDSSIPLTTLETIVQHVSDITAKLYGEETQSIADDVRSPSPAPSTTSTVSTRSRSSSFSSTSAGNEDPETPDKKERRKSI